MAANVEEDHRNNQYRCSMKGLYELYDKIHDNLREEHLQLLDKTPFKLLFRALLEKRIHTKNRKDKILDEIIKTYDQNKQAFKIGSKYTKIYKSEIQFIFGIQDGISTTCLRKSSKNKTAFIQRNFPEVKKVTSKMIKDQIWKVIPENNDNSVQDSVRLLCLLLFQNCFFSTTGQVLGWKYVNCVENLDNMKIYDWSYLIHRNLHESLNEKHKHPQKVNGCTLALFYWFCEKYKKISPKEEEAVKSKDKPAELKGIPRITKWKISSLDELFSESYLSEIKEEEFNWNMLKPTKKELKLMANGGKEKEGNDESHFQNSHDKKKRIDAPVSSSRMKVKSIMIDASESSSRNVKSTLTDSPRKMTRSPRKENDDVSEFQELIPKKRRTDTSETPSRKKGKQTEHNDNQKKKKEVLNQQPERKVPRKSAEKIIDSSQYLVFDVPTVKSMSQNNVESILQEVLMNISPENEKDQWVDSNEKNTEVVRDQWDTPEELKDTVKDLPLENERRWEAREENDTMNIDAFNSTEELHDVPIGIERIVKMNKPTKAGDMYASKDEIDKKVLEFKILQTQVKSMEVNMNELLKKIKNCEDKEKESNCLARRNIDEHKLMELKVGSLKIENEQLKMRIRPKEPEMKAFDEDVRQKMKIIEEDKAELGANITSRDDEKGILQAEKGIITTESSDVKEGFIKKLQEKMKIPEEEKRKSDRIITDLKSMNQELKDRVIHLENVKISNEIEIAAQQSRILSLENELKITKDDMIQFVTRN